MKKQILILIVMAIGATTCFAQSTTLTKVLVDRKYGWGYPSLTKKDRNGYPLVEALVIPNIYDDATNATFADEYSDLIGVKLNGKWGYIDATGATKIPFKYDEAGYFHEGLAPVIVNGKCGFINKSGTTVIPFKYEYASSFTDGRAYVELAGKVGFIDKTGAVIIPVKYDKQTDAMYKKCVHCGPVYSFENGKTTVILNGKCGVIDTKGNFTACEVEALDSTTFTGTVNASKNQWGGNPGAAIKGSCDKSTDIKGLWFNGKDITGTITYENHMMYLGFGKLKAGDNVTIKILHLKGCSFKLAPQMQGFDLGAGQGKQIEKAEQPVATGLDSTIFSGTVAAQGMAIFQSSNGPRDIKKVVLNGVDITAKLPVQQRIILNLGVYKLKKGQPVTVKIVHTKDSTVKLLDPKGIE